LVEMSDVFSSQEVLVVHAQRSSGPSRPLSARGSRRARSCHRRGDPSGRKWRRPAKRPKTRGCPVS